MSPTQGPPRDLVELASDRVILSIPGAEAASHVVSYLEDNRDHLRRWSSTEPAGLYTIPFWRNLLDRYRAEYREGRSVRFMLSPADAPERIIGNVGFSNIVRGAFQACHLGYAIDHRFQGRGLMSEAVKLGIHHMFEHEKLHRVMANYMPTNERSGALLKRLGFQVEGYARDYLFIGGAWRDHILTSLHNPAPTPPLPS